MTETLVIALLMLPCVIALLAARKAQSNGAKQLLRWGGIFFLVIICICTMLQNQCSGSLLKGFVQCNPALLLSIGNGLAPALLLSLLGYIFIGPVIIAAAAILEFLHRKR